MKPVHHRPYSQDVGRLLVNPDRRKRAPRTYHQPLGRKSTPAQPKGSAPREATVTPIITDRAISQLLWDQNRQPSGCRPFFPSRRHSFNTGDRSNCRPSSHAFNDSSSPKRSLCPVPWACVPTSRQKPLAQWPQLLRCYFVASASRLILKLPPRRNSGTFRPWGPGTEHRWQSPHRHPPRRRVA